MSALSPEVLAPQPWLAALSTLGRFLEASQGCCAPLQKNEQHTSSARALALHAECRRVPPQIERQLDTLDASKARWAGMSPTERVKYIDQLLVGLGDIVNPALACLPRIACRRLAMFFSLRKPVRQLRRWIHTALSLAAWNHCRVCLSNCRTFLGATLSGRVRDVAKALLDLCALTSKMTGLDRMGAPGDVG